MTIVEAIKAVLSENPEGLTSVEIYDKIIEGQLYVFNALSPQSIVNGMVRRHCLGLDFSTASPHKYFRIMGKKQGKCIYSLYDASETPNITFNPKQAISKSADELTPEEKIQDAYNEHIALLKKQLMDAILNSSPAFFEELVVQLLLKMGYGYDQTAGRVTRYSKDGGIDGIIEEDKLGLDKIYIQAKRYDINNTIDTATVDQFATAIGKKGVKKGVFITTSRFVKNANEEYSKPVDGKTIRLIDGEELMGLLIKYEIGITTVKNYQTYKIDENFFDS